MKLPFQTTVKKGSLALRLALAGGVALLVVLLAQEGFVGLSILQRLELATLDYRFQYRGTDPSIRDSSHVVIVEIAEDSFTSLPDKYPWPRSYYAHIVRNLRAAGARAVGIDLIFSDRDAVPANDQALYAVIKETGLVVLAGKRAQDNPLYIQTSAHEDFGNIFYASDSALGLVNIRADEDGVYRLYNPYFLVDAPGKGSEPVPTFGFAVLNKYLGFDPHTVPEDRGDHFTYAGRVLPKYDAGSLLINYFGPNGTFRHIKFHDVIDDSTFTTLEESSTGEQTNTFSDPDFGYLYDGTFKDKIVLIGVTVPEYKDLFPVSFGRGEQRGDNLMYGVEMHANLIESVLRDKFLRMEPAWLQVASIILFALITFFATSSFKEAPGRRDLLVEVNSFLFVTAEIMAVGALSLMLFARAGYVITVIAPSLAIIGGYAASTVYTLAVERKRRLLITSMFSTYVNRSVVDELIADPAKLKLGGERKELTVMFTDIEGFTTIAEEMAPEDLVMLLNEYLSVMSRIIFAHNGTLDKYEGDAVMAFWGAPVPHADHALRACHSALEMQEALARLNEAWRVQGKPPLRMRVGVNTGEMVVGNMGAEGKFAYTVIGDSVNLASRLEGSNKEFQTGILVSQRTYELVRAEILGRELGHLVVKGRSEPVIVYELVQRRDRHIDPVTRRFLEKYDAGMAFYHEGRYAEACRFFEEALSIHPDDRATLLHIERIRKRQRVDS